MNFRVGQKVVAIKEISSSETHIAIAKGALLTVRGVVTSPLAHDRGGVGLLLEETRNGIHPDCGLEYAYRIKNFRPAVEPDISVFTAALTKTRKENLRLAKRPVKEDA